MPPGELHVPLVSFAPEHNDVCHSLMADEGRTIMSERWIVKCQNTEDGTGDIIIDLPQELLDQMGLGVGDDLELTVANDTLVLTPVHNATSVRPMFAGVLRHDVYHAYRMRLDALLHISVNASDLDIHDMIVAGFSVSLIKMLCDDGTLSDEERDRIIQPKTLKTKLSANQRLTLHESDRLFRFAHITAMAEVIFGDKGKAKQWLSKPKARFLGESPLAMVTTTFGTHLVEEMLTQVSEGMSF